MVIDDLTKAEELLQSLAADVENLKQILSANIMLGIGCIAKPETENAARSEQAAEANAFIASEISANAFDKALSLMHAFGRISESFCPDEDASDGE